MSRNKPIWNLGAIALCTASFAWAGSPNPISTLSAPTSVPAKSAPAFPAKAKSKPFPAIGPIQGNSYASGNLQGTVDPAAPVPTPPAASAPKAALADAFIAQNVLRVYLNRPASISVYNSRGQQVYRLDSQRPMEAVPLQGITTGFIYLTVHTAQGETTRKLVYTGK